MAKSPAFQFYASDWLVGTSSMTPAQKGGYIDLLAYEWANESIPKEIIRKLSRLSKKDFAIIIKKFALVDDKFYVNNKLELIRHKQREFSKIQSERGKKGGRPKAAGNPDESQVPLNQTKTSEGETFLEDRRLKTEDISFEKSEKLFSDDDERLNQYDEWAKLIIEGRDPGFEVVLYNSKTDPSEITHDRMIQYIGLLNTYPKKRPVTQRQFRKSVLAYIVEQKPTTKNGKPYTKKSDQIDPATGKQYNVIA